MVAELSVQVERGVGEARGQGEDLPQGALAEQREERVDGVDGPQDIRGPAGVEVLGEGLLVRAAVGRRERFRRRDRGT